LTTAPILAFPDYSTLKYFLHIGVTASLKAVDVRRVRSKTFLRPDAFFGRQEINQKTERRWSASISNWAQLLILKLDGVGFYDDRITLRIAKRAATCPAFYRSPGKTTILLELHDDHRNEKLTTASLVGNNATLHNKAPMKVQYVKAPIKSETSNQVCMGPFALYRKHLLCVPGGHKARTWVMPHPGNTFWNKSLMGDHKVMSQNASCWQCLGTHSHQASDLSFK
jgi:hypothetical protein